MANNRRKYTYTGHKSQRYKIRWVILGILIFILLYISVSSLFFSMVVLENDSMADNLRADERFVFSSYNFYSLLPGADLEKEPFPFQRGSVVLVEMFREERPGFFFSFLDGVVRFFTLQRFNLLDQREHLFVKRIIGLPGDEITIADFLVRVKVKGSIHSLTEFEVTEKDYTPGIPRLPALWDSTLPFSGNMESIVLGDNEVFVLSDDRNNTNDSRTWGTVPVRNITGKALFRYWPINRLGRI